MKQTFVPAAALFALLAAALGLHGQTYWPIGEEMAAVENVRLRLGPLRLVPRFRLTEAGYDSNVYFRDGDGEVVADATATLSPELRAFWRLGRSGLLSFAENPEYLFFAREKNLRVFTNSYAAALRLGLVRAFSLSGEYHVQSHVRRVMHELDRRIRDATTGGTAALFFETPRGTAVGVTGRIDDYRYKDVASEVPDGTYGRSLDRRETSAGLEAYYRVFSSSHVFAVVDWTRYEFVHPESAWRDAEAVSASGGLRFPLTGRARGAVRLGWKSFRPDSPDRKPFSGLIAATDVTVRSGRFGVTVGFARNNAFSYNESAYYYVDSVARAGLSLYVFRGLRFDLGAQLGRISYPEPQTVYDHGVPVVIARRADTQRNFSIGPVVRVSGAAGIGLTCNFYARTSNAPGFDVHRNFIGAFLTYEF